MTTIDEPAIRNEVAVIGALARGLHKFLAGLSDDELGKQSACDAWTVRDVAGHLTNRAERQIASMTRGRTGDSDPPAGFSPPADMMAMSAANADADIEYSRSLGDALVPTFEQRYRELHGLLDGFSGDDWRCACWHPRRGTMTAREYVSQRIQELAVHDWDIRSSLDANAGLHPDAIPVLLGMSAHWLRAAYNPGDAPPAGEVRYRFALADGEAMDVLVGPDGARVGPVWDCTRVRLTSPWSAMPIPTCCWPMAGWIWTRRWRPGRLRAEGTHGLLQQFARWMVGF